MRLFEAILEANSRAVAGDENAGLHPDDFAEELPVVALTCIDARLNRLLPAVLGVPEDEFIWLRNAGNIITGPMSSTVRSLALACAIKCGKEIAVIGHTDCQVCKTSTMQLLDQLKHLGVERHVLPENLSDFFGVFASERQNVIKACEIIRQSPIISLKIPVHGLVVDIQSGALEWLVNGYQKWITMSDKVDEFVKSAGQTVDKLKSLTDFQIGEMKFPETKIGEKVMKAEDWLSKKIGELEIKPAEGDEPSRSSAASIAKQIVELAEKHWPQPEARAEQPAAPTIPIPPPIPRRRIPRQGKK